MQELFDKHLKMLKGLETTFRSPLLAGVPWEQPLVGITGARGVGKTTLLLQYIKEKYQYGKQALYISFDGISFPYDTLTALVEDFTKQGGKHLFIDEIHKYPAWSAELKDIYDTYRHLRVTFTGSSILDIYKGQADLSRRALVFKMQGLSFRQYLEIETGQNLKAYTLSEILDKHREISIEILEKLKPFQFFSDYLKYGYYPYYLQSKDYYLMRLSNVINQIVEVDLPQIAPISIEYVNKLKRFLNILSNDIPYKPNISSLAKVLGISWQSVIKYLNYLSKAEIIHILFPKSQSTKSLAKPEKVYLYHPNLFYVFKNQVANKGSLRETFFVNQLAYKHTVRTARKGDFLVDKQYTFEVGGRKKGYKQIADIEQSYVVADDIEFGYENKIPLWLFGFLY